MIWQALGAALNLSMGGEALFQQWKMVEETTGEREKYTTANCKCRLAAKRRFLVFGCIGIEVFYLVVKHQGTWWNDH